MVLRMVKGDLPPFLVREALTLCSVLRKDLNNCGMLLEAAGREGCFPQPTQRMANSGNQNNAGNCCGECE